MDSELRDRLTALEEFLRPKDLVSRVRGLVVAARAGSLNLDDFDDDDQEQEDESNKTARHAARAARSAVAIRELGHDLAADENAFRTLLPELMGGDGRVSAFGEALAEACEDLRATWDTIIAQFAATEGAGLQLPGGFLRGLQKRDPALADAILDEMLEHPAISAWFPVLQAIVTVDERAIERLHRALELGKAPIERFYNLAYGRALDTVAGPKFRELAIAIARKPDGCAVGIEMISMRFHSDRSEKRDPSPEVLEAGRIILGEFEFHGNDSRNTRQDYQLGVIVRASLGGREGVSVARRLCRKLMTAASNRKLSTYDYNDLMKSLLEAHPFDILDELFSGDAESRKQSVRLLKNLVRIDKTILDVLPDDIVLTWCDRDPTVRYPLAASVAVLFKRPKEGEPHAWTPLAGKLLKNAPDPRPVLNEIVQRLYPSSWSGSLATKLEGRLKLLSAMPGGGVPALAAAMAQATANLQARIDAERRREMEEDRAHSNRFE
jgi:hypothetical protein